MIDTIIKGWIIGVLISAPLGPIGILCIQRTLNKGRTMGLITGLGAATSDFVYGLLTGLCLTAVMGFIETHQATIQIGGSIVLLGFGYYLFTQNPTRNIKNLEVERESKLQYYATAFLLTLSNPFILFLYIALFAQFGFTIREKGLLEIAVSYLSIVIGALSWWSLITFLIDKLRSQFNLRSLRIINKIIGGVVIIMSVVGLVAGTKLLLV